MRDPSAHRQSGSPCSFYRSPPHPPPPPTPPRLMPSTHPNPTYSESSSVQIVAPSQCLLTHVALVLTRLHGILHAAGGRGGGGEAWERLEVVYVCAQVRGRSHGRVLIGEQGTLLILFFSFFCNVASSGGKKVAEVCFFYACFLYVCVLLFWGRRGFSSGFV